MQPSVVGDRTDCLSGSWYRAGMMKEVSGSSSIEQALRQLVGRVGYRKKVERSRRGSRIGLVVVRCKAG